VTLPVSGDVGGPEISDRSFIDDSWRKVSSLDQVAGPFRDVRIDVVVEGRRQRLLEHERTAIDAEEARRCAAVPHVEREVARDHRLGRARRGRQPAARQLRDLARLERARSDLAQDLGDDGERAHRSSLISPHPTQRFP
jgi:hypothetical protein